MRWWIIVFLLFAFSLSGTTIGQSPQKQNPLDDFLTLLENSGANMLVMSSSDREGTPYQKSGFVRFKEDCGVESKMRDGTDRRWIWNSDYVALIQKVGQGRWSLQRILTPDTELYLATLDTATTATHLLGGSMLRRIESLDPAYSISESDDSIYEYQFLSDCTFFSTDPVLNSMEFRFARNRKEPRLLEIRGRESAGGPGSEVIIETVQTFKYPDGGLFPVNLVARGVLIAGSIPEMRDEELWKGKIIEFDEEAKFDRSECYLTHYGLPEPTFARENRTWAWWLLAALLAVATGAVLWKRFANVSDN